MERARAWTERVAPKAGGELPSFMRLREPAGRDELSLAGVDTSAAVALLDRLVEPQVATGELAASDRDRLLAALHRSLWGDRIVSSLECAGCGAMYDLSFELSGLEDSLEAGREASRAAGARRIEDKDGRAYRLPSAQDEEDAATRGRDAGRAMLAASIADGLDPDALDMRLEALAPILDVDLDAPCAECGHPAMLRFDIQTFTLQRLLDEREAMVEEVHKLATAYGWSLGEILELQRSLRRRFAERCEGHS
jgi:hypothetical protein